MADQQIKFKLNLGGFGKMGLQYHWKQIEASQYSGWGTKKIGKNGSRHTRQGDAGNIWKLVQQLGWQSEYFDNKCLPIESSIQEWHAHVYQHADVHI